MYAVLPVSEGCQLSASRRRRCHRRRARESAAAALAQLGQPESGQDKAAAVPAGSGEDESAGSEDGFISAESGDDSAAEDAPAGGGGGGGPRMLIGEWDPDSAPCFTVPRSTPAVGAAAQQHPVGGGVQVRLTDRGHSTLHIRVRVEILGSQTCRVVGKSQPFLMMINPIIFTRTRTLLTVRSCAHWLMRSIDRLLRLRRRGDRGAGIGALARGFAVAPGRRAAPGRDGALPRGAPVQ
jgi:hypothetical protein